MALKEPSASAVGGRDLAPSSLRKGDVETTLKRDLSLAGSEAAVSSKATRALGTALGAD